MSTARIQEDLILLQSETRDGASARALEIGREVGDFGRRLLDGDAAAMGELSIPEHLSASILHPSMAPVYEEFRFLGVRETFSLIGGVEHGAELGLRAPLGPNHGGAMGHSPALLQAFRPAGPAYQGSSQVKENRRLHSLHHWYVAEQVFRCRNNPDFAGREAAADLARLVMLEAQTPEEALASAMANGDEWGRSHSCEFATLQQLSLVTDAIEDGCELHWRIIEVDDWELQNLERVA